MFLRAAITGNLGKAMDAQVVSVARALRRAVATAGAQVQAELRAQVRGAGFKDGGRAIANAWRLRVYPRPGVGPRTLKPAATIYSNMPDVATAFDKGVTITAKGGKYLAFPTGFNSAGGRRGAGRRAGLRVTTDQMVQAGGRGEAFVLPLRGKPRRALWCLRVAAATGTSRRTRNRLRLFVNKSTEVATGRVKGLQQRRKDILKQGFVPMFFLTRRVTLRKRLNIAAVRAKAPRVLSTDATAELAALR